MSKKTSTKFSEELIADCLRLMESGGAEDLFEIIPRIGVLRDRRFHQPLQEMLEKGNIKKREFAAYAMGAMGDREFLEPLRKAFADAQQNKEFGAEEYLLAVIEAIGVIGDDAAVEVFLPVLEAGKGSPGVRRWIIESLGAMAQQGGARSIQALSEITHHKDSDLRAQAISELSVAHWHRPNDIPDSILQRIYDLTQDRSAIVAESALAALQSLADVGCLRAEELFEGENE